MFHEFCQTFFSREVVKDKRKLQRMTSLHLKFWRQKSTFGNGGGVAFGGGGLDEDLDLMPFNNCST